MAHDPQYATETRQQAQLEALRASLGVVTDACKQSGVPRRTHYNWMDSDEAYREAYEMIVDEAIDFAETQLHNLIAEGNVRAIIFYLKTKGKHRGYTERFEYHNQVEPSKLIVYVDGSEDETS